jgi:DNA modification methylase
MCSEAVTDRLSNFVHLTEIENACKMMRADLLVHLIDVDGLRAIDIARATGLRQSDLSEMYKTAKTFPMGLRPDGVPFNLFLLATRTIRKFPGLKLRPQTALEQIRRHGFSQHREVGRHFAQVARLAESRRAVRGLEWAGDSVTNRAYHKRFQELINLVADGSAKIIHVDPPYVYRNNIHGHYASKSARSQVCDNQMSRAGISLVVDLLREWQPKLTSGGVLLLWQPSGPLLTQIMHAVEECSWMLEGPIIWDKGRPQPGHFDSPYSTQTEMLWVLSRPGDAPINHDGSSRSDILRFSPVSFPGSADDQQHCFEKPQALCEFLVRKHSYAGELVLDLCGCTGSMSVAAIETGRRWIYVESNEENYQMGAARIAQSLAKPTMGGGRKTAG